MTSNTLNPALLGFKPLLGSLSCHRRLPGPSGPAHGLRRGPGVPHAHVCWNETLYRSTSGAL